VFMAIRKTLIPYGTSLALVLDRSTLDLLGISKETPLDITTDGLRLLVTPVFITNRQPAAVQVATTPVSAMSAPESTPTVPDSVGAPPLQDGSDAASHAGDGGRGVRAEPWMGNYAPARLVRGDHRIRVVVAGNPKREGSATRLRFDRYREGMTVDEAYAVGIKPEDVRWDVAHGFIELH
jgi:hypothetical protein